LRQFLRNIFLSPGPVLALALIGLMVLCGLLYYKAVRFQRFLEPALALTQPGSEFDEDVRDHLRSEFGPEYVNDIRYAQGTILVSEAALVGKESEGRGMVVYEKLSSVFVKILEDVDMRGDVRVILVSTMARVSDDPKLVQFNADSRRKTQDRADDILNVLYEVEPELETTYGLFFETTAIPVYSEMIDTSWVNFRLMPSEKLHIEVLQKLEKYID
jgi:hypothetical protein